MQGSNIPLDKVFAIAGSMQYARRGRRAIRQIKCDYVYADETKFCYPTIWKYPLVHALSFFIHLLAKTTVSGSLREKANTLRPTRSLKKKIAKAEQYLHSSSPVARPSFITQPTHNALPSISLKYPHNRHANSPTTLADNQLALRFRLCRSERLAYCCRCCCYFYARKCCQCFQLMRALGAHSLVTMWRVAFLLFDWHVGKCSMLVSTFSVCLKCTAYPAAPLRSLDAPFSGVSLFLFVQLFYARLVVGARLVTG